MQEVKDYEKLLSATDDLFDIDEEKEISPILERSDFNGILEGEELRYFDKAVAIYIHLVKNIDDDEELLRFGNTRIVEEIESFPSIFVGNKEAVKYTLDNISFERKSKVVSYNSDTVYPDALAVILHLFIAKDEVDSDIVFIYTNNKGSHKVTVSYTDWDIEEL